MTKKIATEVRRRVKKFFGAERYVLVFKTEGTTFILNKSYFGGSQPIRPLVAFVIKWQKQLLFRVFESVADDVSYEVVVTKGLSYKTFAIVCDMPEHWSLARALHLHNHIVSLDVVRESEPIHAKLIEQICSDAEEQKKISKAA